LKKALKMIFFWVGGIAAVLCALLVAFLLTNEEPFNGPFPPFEITCQGTQPNSRIFLSKPSKSSDLVLTVGSETDILKEVDLLPEFGARYSEGVWVYQGQKFSLRYDPEINVHMGNELIGSSCS
jgi:hypothetical protein